MGSLSGKADASGDAELFIARRIFPSLPSFSDEFTCAVPMTRIRDIAHRGDIPHDMKQCLGTFKSFICDFQNPMSGLGWKIRYFLSILFFFFRLFLASNPLVQSEKGILSIICRTSCIAALIRAT